MLLAEDSLAMLTTHFETLEWIPWSLKALFTKSANSSDVYSGSTSQAAKSVVTRKLSVSVF